MAELERTASEMELKWKLMVEEQRSPRSPHTPRSKSTDSEEVVVTSVATFDDEASIKIRLLESQLRALELSKKNIDKLDDERIAEMENFKSSYDSVADKKIESERDKAYQQKLAELETQRQKEINQYQLNVASIETTRNAALISISEASSSPNSKEQLQHIKALENKLQEYEQYKAKTMELESIRVKEMESFSKRIALLDEEKKKELDVYKARIQELENGQSVGTETDNNALESKIASLDDELSRELNEHKNRLKELREQNELLVLALSNRPPLPPQSAPHTDLNTSQNSNSRSNAEEEGKTRRQSQNVSILSRRLGRRPSVNRRGQESDTDIDNNAPNCDNDDDTDSSLAIHQFYGNGQFQSDEESQASATKTIEKKKDKKKFVIDGETYDVNTTLTTGRSIHLYVKFLLQNVYRPDAELKVKYSLQWGIYRQDRSFVKEYFIGNPTALENEDVNGMTALHVACAIGSDFFCDLLFEQNVDVNVVDRLGLSPLHMCSDPKLIAALCSKGANPNLADKRGFVPLHYYFINGQIDHVKEMLINQADVSIPVPIQSLNILQIASRDGLTDMVTTIILYGKKVDLNIEDVDGNAPAHLVLKSATAAGLQHTNLMLLLDRGASVTQRNKRGESLLLVLCSNRALYANGIAEPLLQILIDMGGDPNAADCEGCTPLIVACAYRNWELCKVLLQAGGDLNLPCPMNSYLIRQDDEMTMEEKSNAFDASQEVTASDLMPRSMRELLFCYICAPQTQIPCNKRDNCMNCGNPFDSVFESVKSEGGDAASPDGLYSRSYSTQGRHATSRLNCAHCNRVVCDSCSGKIISRNDMPDFIRNESQESNFNVCLPCHSVLMG
jgi:ankyrin repeat protein